MEEAVLPALAFAVNKGVDICPPLEVSDFLAAVLSLNRERNQRIWLELRATVQLLNGVSVEPVLLKGAAYLAAGVYSDLGARYLLDLDLLVPEQQLNKAFQHLVENGYVYDETDQFGRFRHHYPPLRRAAVPIELHHRLGLGPCQSILAAKDIVENAAPLEIDGMRVRVPSSTHLVMHLVMHSQIQHPYNERIWPPLRVIYDLLRLQCHFRSLIDWAEVEYRFKRAGQIGLLQLHLIDVRDALGLEPPIDFKLTPATRLRGLRRRTLRRSPVLRYLDPIYMFSTVCVRRLRVLRNVLRAPGGVKRLLIQLFASGTFERLLVDVLERTRKIIPDIARAFFVYVVRHDGKRPCDRGHGITFQTSVITEASPQPALAKWARLAPRSWVPTRSWNLDQN